MTLLETIGQDFLMAYKAKDEFTTSVLRMIKSAIKNAEIDNKGMLDDEAVRKLLKTEIKKRKESMAEYASAGRADLAEKEGLEAALLEKYLPAQLPMADIEAKVGAILAGLSPEQKNNFGAVMGIVMKELGSQADGTVVRTVVQQKLAS